MLKSNKKEIGFESEIVYEMYLAITSFIFFLNLLL